MDVTFLEDQPFFSVSPLQWKNLTQEETNNFSFPLMSIPFVPSTESTPMFILPTNENVLWITYYRRNIRKEVVSPTVATTQTHESEPTPVQSTYDFLSENNDVDNDN